MQEKHNRNVFPGLDQLVGRWKAVEKEESQESR